MSFAYMLLDFAVWMIVVIVIALIFDADVWPIAIAASVLSLWDDFITPTRNELRKRR